MRASDPMVRARRALAKLEAGEHELQAAVADAAAAGMSAAHVADQLDMTYKRARLIAVNGGGWRHYSTPRVDPPQSVS